MSFSCLRTGIVPAILFAFVVLDGGLLFAQLLTEENYDQLVPAGKEVDAIYGDFALQNKSAKAVIAFPGTTRNCNMTVRNVGGCLIDFAATSHESDQLGSFYPGRRKFAFSTAKVGEHSVIVTSTGSETRPKCEVRYQFNTDQPVIEVTSTWSNTTKSDWTLSLEDDLRADGGKEDMVRSPNGTHDVFYVDDVYWQQAYAVCAPGYRIRSNSNSRECVLVYEPADGNSVVMKPGKSFTLTRYIVVGRNLPNVLAMAEQIAMVPVVSYPCELTLVTADGNPAEGARIEFRRGKELRGTVRPDENGAAQLKLPEGTYTVNATIGGVALLPRNSVALEVRSGGNKFELQSPDYRPGRVVAKITDGDGLAIPAKVEFIGAGDTATPNWGPDSAEHFVRNLAYTADGTFTTSLQAGNYDVIVSHGPEYDAVFTKLTVIAGQSIGLEATLRHSVRTPGWVSSDFHSHSSPSGDNTGSQKGRVLNLAAENIEFAPCTEHNRVSTYAGHVAELGLKRFLATVTGMELTGQPLPLNHQNVFPMKHTPRTQDGGGPVTDSSPETQIERIALWDDRSEKLIQQDHPDLGWLFYDKNGDGISDSGYSRSFPLMDVMEIHPIDRILNVTQFDQRNGKAFGNNRMLNWLQLLNQGYRIYGVVNTDAHYNYHGSGWLRNWIQSSTDNPAMIDPMEMVHASKQGRLVMSNGPYLEVSFKAAVGGEVIVSGQDLVAKSGKVSAHVRVQCPNWFDVDTVFVLINGKVAKELQFTRGHNADMFHDDVLKFDRSLDIVLKQDSHIVVVTGHRTETLGDVAGPTWGKQHPAALTNPVFIDVDGNGFQPNEDTLGFPLPVKFGQSSTVGAN
ncbi:MAG TPA: carboxypeptidase regulatory-like domain-containing protein [Planctomycetes bacterium]|nr:carboxypeptidase regulatory-like domain-containing protein [Fuerstiella sp.]HIK90557.1 carboxypeptidase regulatory-like domain-containing protein [Planctomycetota bacterium]